MARRQFDQESNRLDYSQLLFPELDYELDFAVGMTYSVDMEALLGIPVSLGMLEDMESNAVHNPFFILEAIRKSSDKLAIFCNADGIKMPQNIRPVYALLENSLFPVDLGAKANFHPKLWVIRYHSSDAVQIKVIILSRNLTFDRSMDIAVEMTGTVDTRNNEAHRPLADMLSFVAGFAGDDKRNQVRSLARDVLRVSRFQCEEQYESYEFLPIGIPKYKNKAESMFSDAQSLIVMSPFLSEGITKQLTETPRQTALITRKASLSPSIYNRFQFVYVPIGELMDNEILEEADKTVEEKRDLHAKIFFKSCYDGNFLYLGSLNASANAFYHNVEFMLKLKYKPYYASFQSVLNDFVPETSCPFERINAVPEDNPIADNEESMDKLSDVIAALKRAKVVSEGKQYRIEIDSDRLETPAEIAPLYRAKVFKPISDRIIFEHMLLKELSELYVIRRDGFYCLVKLPTDGIPIEERDRAIYNDVISSKSGFLSYVAFLLADDYSEAGLEQHDLLETMRGSSELKSNPIASALYERLLRTAVYYPDRLDAVEGIMQKVDPDLVDDEFRSLITTFKKAVRR
jgi:hypothetical protein